MASRGPDLLGHAQVGLGNGASLLMCSSLLQLRGKETAAAPHVDADGNSLLFNGEVFGGLEVPAGANDGEELLHALGREHCDILEQLSAIRGPWALVYWHAATRTLWFGRDAIGRRSLLIHLPDARCGQLLISSVAQPGASAESMPSDAATDKAASNVTAFEVTSADSCFWQEMEPGICSIGFGDSRLLEGRPLVAVERHAWKDLLLPALATYMRPSHLHHPLPEHDVGLPDACQKVLAALQAAVDTRCGCIDMLPAATSTTRHQQGLGDDSKLAPAPLLILFSGGIDSTLLAALAHRSLPPDAPIDLATICFDGGRSPDRQSALDAYEELVTYAPDREWRLILIDSSLEDVDAHKKHVMDLLYPSTTVMDLNIGAALWLAARAQGTLLVHTPDSHLPKDDSPSADAASTCTAALHNRSSPQPNGSGGRAERATEEFYRSRARVVLLGHGADELCAGYGRHRTRFRLLGWEGLASELALDVGRLWRRNLGRDDRIVADSGREARHPFLDEAFVAALLTVPLPLVANLALPPGQGDKMILRAALSSLGLRRAAARVKRAIQFGSRLSKQANVRDFGSNRAANIAKAGTVRLSEVNIQNFWTRRQLLAEVKAQAEC